MRYQHIKIEISATERETSQTTDYIKANHFNSFVVLFVEIELGLHSIVGGVDVLQAVSESWVTMRRERIERRKVSD